MISAGDIRNGVTFEMDGKVMQVIEFQHHYVQLVADFAEFRRMFDFLGPREVGDVNQAVNAFFDFNEHAEVGEVANFGGVARAERIFGFDVLPGIILELFDAERHLAVLAVESENNGFDFVAYFHEFLS